LGSEQSDRRRSRRSVSLAGSDCTLTGDATEGKDHDRSQDTENNDDDEDFDHGETVDLSSIPLAHQSMKSVDHSSSSGKGATTLGVTPPSRALNPLKALQCKKWSILSSFGLGP
jgi:hypothetical protein